MPGYSAIRRLKPTAIKYKAVRTICRRL